MYTYYIKINVLKYKVVTKLYTYYRHSMTVTGIRCIYVIKTMKLITML